MLTDHQEKNDAQFFTDAIATGCIWGLQNEEGWAQCESKRYPQTLVMPFWSQPEYAQIHQQDEWSNYQVVAISLEEFLDDWLTGMHQDVILVGINWNDQLYGEDYEPLDILSEFENLLKGL